MCGFFGVYSFDKNNHVPVNMSCKQHIQKLLHHRGPDSTDWYETPGFSLCCVRLSITGRTDDANMPFISRSKKTVLGYNGEIYNFKELASKYSINCDTGCDTQVLAEMVELFSANCLPELEAIFATSIYDRAQHKLLLARDPIGVKPLFYSILSNSIVFSSELSPILFYRSHSGHANKPDLDTISQYIYSSSYDHTSSTFFSGINTVLPGEIISLLDRKISFGYQFESRQLEYSGSYENTVDQFLELCLESVSNQTDTDIPLNINISSGNDSRFLLALLDRQKKCDNIEMTWSYGYDGCDNEDIADIKNIANHYGVRNTTVFLNSSDVPDLMLSAIKSLEQPFPGLPTLAKYNLFKESARSSHKIFLEGQGGDEIGGGYRYTYGAFIMSCLKKYPDFDICSEFNQYSRVNNLDINQVLSLVLQSQSKLYGCNLSADGTSILPDNLRDLRKSLIVNPPYNKKNWNTWV